jgi:initiation factor 1A
MKIEYGMGEVYIRIIHFRTRNARKLTNCPSHVRSYSLIMPKRGETNLQKHNRAGTRGTNELVIADDDSCFPIVKENNGSLHFRIMCQDNVKRLGILRSNMRKRSWFRKGDIIMLTLRDYQNSKADIVHNFTHTNVIRGWRRWTKLPLIHPSDNAIFCPWWGRPSKRIGWVAFRIWRNV